MDSHSQTKNHASWLFWSLLAGALLLAGLFALLAGHGERQRSSLPFMGSVVEDNFGPGLGVIRVEDVIVDTDAQTRTVNRWRKDDRIRGLLVRIDSPGGAVAPSQQLYDALRHFDKAKPVVAVMGSVAASGGYYIAAASREIWAMRGTLTGSIGVIMQSMDLSGLAHRLGVTDQTVKSGVFKDIGSPFRAATTAERSLLQGVVDDTYQQFVDDILASRTGMKREQLLAIADGRVFTGRQALRVGLVDKLGSFAEAVSSLAGDVGLSTDDPLLIYPERDWEGRMSKILRRLQTSESSSLLGPLWMVWKGRML